MGACEVRHLVEGPADSSAVVLLNSLGTDLGFWSSQVPALLAAGHRVVRYDARGHGGSPLPPGPYTVAALGADLLALLDRLGISRATLCGVSLGGATALWAAAHAGERVDRLVVCFSSADFGPADGWLARAELVRREGTEAVADAVLARWLTPAAAAEQPQLPARMREMLVATPAAGYASSCEAIAALDLGPELGAITAPTLVVSGAEDPATPPEHGRRIAAAVAGARFTELPAAAHLGNVERPAAFNAILLDALAATLSGEPG